MTKLSCKSNYAKKHVVLFTILLIVTFLISSCASPLEIAQKDFDRGNYVGAVKSSLKSLEKEYSPEADQMLQMSWERGTQDFESQINNLKTAGAISDLERCINVYQDLMDLHTLVELAGHNELNPDYNRVKSESDELIIQLADMYVKDGNLLLSSESKEEAKTACKYFARAKELNPGCSNIDKLIAQAKEEATVKVFICTAPEATNLQSALSIYDSSLNLDSADMVSQIEEVLEKNEFVKVIDETIELPFDNDSSAIKYAKMLGADILLKFAPTTFADCSVKENREQLNDIFWKKTVITLNTSASTNFNYKIIDLADNSVIDSGNFETKDSGDGGFSISAIGEAPSEKTIDVDNVGSRKVKCQFVTVGLTASDLAYTLKYQNDIDVPSMGASESFGIEPATDYAGTKFNVNDLSPIAYDLSNIEGLNGHTFFLFDIFEFTTQIQSADSQISEQISQQYVYNNEICPGEIGYIKTAEYDRKLWFELKDWLASDEVATANLLHLLPYYYKTTAPNAFANHIADLF